MTHVPATPLVPAVEATLIAHRRLLRLVLAECAARDPGLLDRVAGGPTHPDAQEDPGSQPDLAFAIESAAAREVAALLDEVRVAVGHRREDGADGIPIT